jgi:hypothetical protein
MAKRHRRVTPLIVPWTAAIAALTITGSAAAVEVRGLLQVAGPLTHPSWESPRPPLKPYWEEWNGFLDPGDGKPSKAQVLAAVLRGQGAADDDGCSYALRGGAFAPATMVARKGTTLRIENTDGCSHELYSDDIDELQPLQTAPGNARTVPLAATGHFVIRDRLYPHVVGHLHVVDDLVACAEVNDKGFRFPEVPDGTYTVEVYHGKTKVASQSVEASGRYHTTDPLTVTVAGE